MTATSATAATSSAEAAAAAAAQAAEAKAGGPLMAIEALNLATLNVISFAVMFVGGMSFAFDISSIDELRAKARQVIGGAAGGRTDEEAEREVEEWVARVLARKEAGKARDADRRGGDVVLKPGEAQVVLKGDR
jgi:hypothetical protein